MYVAVLVSNPGVARLTPEIVRPVRDRLNGGTICWLADGQACEFLLGGKPGAGVIRGIRTRLHPNQVDLCVVPGANRKKRVLFADMDSTMILEESLDELAAHVGIGEEVKKITAAAMNGELEFEEAVRYRVGLLAGLEVSVIDRVVNNQITLAPGGRELVATMKAHGAYSVLVSGGFDDFTRVVATRLGFDEYRANVLLKRDGRLTGEPGTPILGRKAKAEMLSEVTERLGVRADDVLAVGDGANDLDMLRMAGIGAAHHAKPAVAARSRHVLEFADLSGLLFLQGYRLDEFQGPGTPAGTSAR